MLQSGADTLDRLREVLEIPRGQPAGNRAPVMATLKVRYFEGPLNAATEERLKRGQASEASIVYAAFLSQSINDEIPGAYLNIQETVANESWRADQEGRLARTYTKLVPAFATAVRKSYIDAEQVDIPDLINVFDGQNLVTSALLKWPRKTVHKHDPTLYFSPLEIAKLRQEYPLVRLPVFRGVIAEMRLHKHLIPNFLSWLTDHPCVRFDITNAASIKREIMRDLPPDA